MEQEQSSSNREIGSSRNVRRVGLPRKRSWSRVRSRETTQGTDTATPWTSPGVRSDQDFEANPA
eukprot:3759574-Pyramimonas_sp.AAC.1